MSRLLTVKRGDTQPPYLVRLTYVADDGGVTSVDLINATVKVLGQGDTPGMPTLNRVVTGTDQGEVRMDWLAGDTAVAGRFRTEVQVTYPDGAVVTFPADGYLDVVVVPDLGQ